MAPNIDEMLLIMSEEIKKISSDEEINCKVSYINGIKRGIELQKSITFKPVIDAIEETLKKTEE